MSKSVEEKLFDFLMDDAGNYCDCRDEKPEYTCRKHTMTSMAHELAECAREKDVEYNDIINDLHLIINEVRLQLTEAKHDSKRLEWMIEKECSSTEHSFGENFYVSHKDNRYGLQNYFKSPREAIDAAMKANK